VPRLYYSVNSKNSVNSGSDKLNAVVVRLGVVVGVSNICGYRRGVLHTLQICHAVNAVVVRLCVVGGVFSILPLNEDLPR
jgi:hypothetical protein